MDTSQRGMGFDWESAKDLIRRSIAEAKAVAGGELASGAGTDQLAPGAAATIDDVIAATLLLQDDVLVSNSSAAKLTLSGTIGGAGGLTKSGAGLVTISGTNSYLGNTVVAGGVLALAATTLSPANATFDVRSGAALDVTAFGGFTVNAGQTLGGRGAVLGDVAVNSGGNWCSGKARAR